MGGVNFLSNLLFTFHFPWFGKKKLSEYYVTPILMSRDPKMLNKDIY